MTSTSCSTTRIRSDDIVLVCPPARCSPHSPSLPAPLRRVSSHPVNMISLTCATMRRVAPKRHAFAAPWSAAAVAFATASTMTAASWPGFFAAAASTAAKGCMGVPPGVTRFETLPSLSCHRSPLGSRDAWRQVPTCPLPRLWDSRDDCSCGDEPHPPWPSSAQTPSPGSTTNTLEFCEEAWSDNTLSRDFVRPYGALWATEWYEPVHAGSQDGGALVHEAEVVRFLTHRWNSLLGSVKRRRSVYDILAVERQTAGLCFGEFCDFVVAVIAAANEASSVAPNGGSIVDIPVMTYRDGSRPPGVVLDWDVGLLSLGRAVLGQPGWLSSHPEWQQIKNLTLYLSVYSSGLRQHPVPPSLAGGRYWSLDPRDDDPRYVDPKHKYHVVNGTGSHWLAAIAYVLCAPPATSFVCDAEWLCAGLSPSRASRQHTSDEEEPPPRGQPRAGSGNAHSAFWSISSIETVFDRPNVSSDDIAYSPCWVAGRGDREINPRSSAERDLARRAGVASVRLPYVYVDRSREPSDLYGHSILHGVHRIDALLDDLSQTFDRRVFGEEPPDDPTSDAEALLAVIVVAPELVALIALLISTREWRRRDLCVLLFVFLSGCVALAGILSLAVREARADAWRGAGVRQRLEPLIPDPGFGQPVPVARSETLLLVARMGYRPVLLARLAIGLSVTYVVTSVIVAALVWVVRRRNPGEWHLGVDVWGEYGDRGGPVELTGAQPTSRSATIRGGRRRWRRLAVPSSLTLGLRLPRRWDRAGQAASPAASAVSTAATPSPTLPPSPTLLPTTAASATHRSMGAGHGGFPTGAST